MTNIISFSGGKDSTAVLLKYHEMNQLENKTILHVSMGEMEFTEMNQHIDKVEKYIGKEIVRIEAFPEGSLNRMLNYTVNKRDKTQQEGYWWCGKQRWGTTYKLQAINKFYKQFDNVIEIIGYATDEKAPSRQKKIAEYKENKPSNIIYPLIDWNMTEKDSLKYCYSKGFDWGGLYELYDRVSCWCCQNNNLKELKNMYLHQPEYWERLKNLDREIEKRVINKYGEYEPKYRYKQRYTLKELEDKFNLRYQN